MDIVEPTPEQNLRLLEEIEANRAFILLAYQSDPALLEVADPEIRRQFDSALPEPAVVERDSSDHRPGDPLGRER